MSKTLFRKYTYKEIEDRCTPPHGYSRKALASMGVHWPPKKGWKSRLLLGLDPNDIHAPKMRVPKRLRPAKERAAVTVYSPLQEEAEVVEEPVQLRKRFCTRYPWPRWFAAKRVILRKGVDYGATQVGMVQNIRAASRRFGVKVSVRVTDTSISMRVVG